MEKVEIICRCKGCIHYESIYQDGKILTFGYCYYWEYETGMAPNGVDETDFCSNASLT